MVNRAGEKSRLVANDQNRRDNLIIHNIHVNWALKKHISFSFTHLHY